MCLSLEAHSSVLSYSDSKYIQSVSSAFFLVPNHNLFPKLSKVSFSLYLSKRELSKGCELESFVFICTVRSSSVPCSKDPQTLLQLFSISARISALLSGAVSTLI